MTRTRGLLPLFLLLFCCATARGQTSLAVEIGWNGTQRIGRWAPIFVTISDPTPRPIRLKVHVPHGGGFAMLASMQLSATPTAATYPIYVPLSQWNHDLTIVARDARTGRWRAQWPDEEQRNQLGLRHPMTEVVIGTSGRGATLRWLAERPDNRQIDVVHIDPLKLPLVNAGFDSLNVLVLNQPDLNRISAEQQHAIADWVRGGGNLIFWAGEEPLPAASPLITILPVQIGENISLEVDSTVLESFGLPERFAQLKGRELHPNPHAERVHLLGERGPVAWRSRVDFGQVLVLPFDPTFFVFRDDEAAKRFYHALVEGMVDRRVLEPQESGGWWSNPTTSRRSHAVNRASDLVGDVPGAGSFGFGYVAGVLIGLMVIVGPVDWFVLRYLGRQPWTWFTTTGWIALVTLSALLIGHVFRSGDLHFRTLRIVDQAGNTRGVTEFIGIYAPRTGYYELSTPRDSWWQPGGDLMYGSSGKLRTEVLFAQDSRSNRPDLMRINVWSLRFLRGETFDERAGPILEARLAWARIDPSDDDSGSKLVGTISNRGTTPLRDMIIRVSNGAIYLDGPPLMPGRSVNVDHAFDSDGAFFAQSPTGYYPRGRSLPPMPGAPETQTPEYWQLADLATDRSARIDMLLSARADLACIYAEAVDPPPGTKLSDSSALERHWQVVRTLVSLEKGENP